MEISQGDLIAIARKKTKLTQEELGIKVFGGSISPSKARNRIKSYESETIVPAKVLPKIAEILRIDIAVLEPINTEDAKTTGGNLSQISIIEKNLPGFEKLVSSLSNLSELNIERDMLIHVIEKFVDEKQGKNFRRPNTP